MCLQNAKSLVGTAPSPPPYGGTSPKGRGLGVVRHGHATFASHFGRGGLSASEKRRKRREGKIAIVFSRPLPRLTALPLPKGEAWKLYQHTRYRIQYQRQNYSCLPFGGGGLSNSEKRRKRREGVTLSKKLPKLVFQALF